MRKFLHITLYFCFLNAQGQNTVGLPEVINYTKQLYNGGSQNWDISQGSNGLIYFGNNEGLLSFDGTFWKVYPLPNQTIVRSVEITSDQKIYVGGQNEFGYFSPGKHGILEYHSLLEWVPVNDRTFDDVWDICEFNGSLFFRTNSRIFQLRNNKITVFPTRTEWRFMTTFNGRLIAEDRESGTLIFNNGQWLPVFQHSALPKDALLTSVIPLDKNRSLITTWKDGFFEFDNSLALKRMESSSTTFLSTLGVYKAIKLNDGNIAIATSMGGCYIINPAGTIIQNLTLTEGLQNNNIRSLMQDQDNNLWLGLENGIDFVAYDNAIKHIYPGPHNLGSGYSAIPYKGFMYLGTSNGLYRFKINNEKNIGFNSSNIEKVINSEGEVWNLSIVNGELFMGHHTGAYIIKDNEAQLFDGKTGFWNFQPLSNNGSSGIMVAGNYLGLGFYKYDNHHFSQVGKYLQFESSRFVVVENEKTIWVAHPYKGIYCITLDGSGNPKMKKFLGNTGLPSANNNYIFKVNGQIILTTGKGIYELNRAEDRFVRSTFLNEKIKDGNITYLHQDPDGNIWYVHGKQISVLDVSVGSGRVINFPELNNKLGYGFENVLPIDRHNIIIGSEKGFYHVDFEKYKNSSKTFRLQVRKVYALAPVDSVLYAGYGHSGKANLPYQSNSLHFEFSAIFYGQQSNIEYSYLLKGFDKDWSIWSSKPEKDYTNLPPGDYELKVKARTNLGNESSASTYSFTINPPWYQSLPAKITYLFLVLLGGYFLIRHQKNKFLNQQLKYEEKQKQMKYLHQLEMDKIEKEIVKLKNEKLEAEIEHKNFELATSAMHLLQKKEMVDKLRDDLNGMLKNIDNEEVFKRCKKLLKALGEDNKLDDSWEHFEMHFDKIHTDFLVQIKQKYPSLTAGELKLCAYIRLNLSTKEIARLLNISTRGVETTRYRLRKKLGLSKEDNLFEYLLEEQFERKRV